MGVREGSLEKIKNSVKNLIYEGERLKEIKEEELLSYYEKWNLKCIELIDKTLGRDSEHLKDFINDKVKGEEILRKIFSKKLQILKKYGPFYRILDHQLSILRSIEENLETQIIEYRKILTLDLYLEILNKAESLLEMNLKDVAAILCYCALEKVLNDEEKRKFQRFIEIGECAISGKFYMYTRDKVHDMIKFTRETIEAQLKEHEKIK